MKTKSYLTAALISAVLLGSTAFAAKPVSDREFIGKALQGDDSEKALGSLAEKRGASAGTRTFGHMLAVDHGRARVQVLALAKKVRAPVPDKPTEEATAEYGKLEGMSGAAFDKEFARYMVEDHKNDIADFTAQASATRDPRIKALAKGTIPVLKKHLATAQSLAAKAR